MLANAVHFQPKKKKGLGDFSPDFNSCRLNDVWSDAMQQRDLFAANEMKNLSKQYRAGRHCASWSGVNQFPRLPTHGVVYAAHLPPEYILALLLCTVGAYAGHLATGNTSRLPLPL